MYRPTFMGVLFLPCKIFRWYMHLKASACIYHRMHAVNQKILIDGGNTPLSYGYTMYYNYQ
jgi:hypothetical protein